MIRLIDFTTTDGTDPARPIRKANGRHPYRCPGILTVGNRGTTTGQKPAVVSKPISPQRGPATPVIIDGRGSGGRQWRRRPAVVAVAAAAVPASPA